MSEKNDLHIETERKFLIAFPELDILKSQSDIRIKEIEQTYLLSENGSSLRVRKLSENGRTAYIRTEKRQISVLSAYEDEREISVSEYMEALKNADKDKETVKKTRYCFGFGGHTVEIDIYPFWDDRAILEIEMSSEDEKLSIPTFIKVIKEVSADSRYKNTRLAEKIPYDSISE